MYACFNRKAKSKGKAADLRLSARQQAKLFQPKNFPKGLGANLWCFQKTEGKHNVWKDYCQILKDSDNEWEIRWSDGETQQVSKKILGMAIQVGQELIIHGRLVKCSGYEGNQALFTYVDLQSGDEEEYVSPKKKSKRKRARKAAPATAATNDNEEAAPATAATNDNEEAAPATAATNAIDNDERIIRLANWSKCRYAALSRKLKVKLSQVYAKTKLKLPYQFVERTIQAYVKLQKDRATHVEADKYLLGAVQATLASVPDESKQNCDAGEITVELRPLLQKVFRVAKAASSPAKNKTPLTTAYTKRLIRSNNYTYSDITTYPDIWDHYLAEMMKVGDHRGYPIVKSSDTVPTRHDQYDAEMAMPHYKAGANKSHTEVPLFRYAALADALRYLRNEGESPIQVRAKDMPTGQTWNNYPPTLYKLHAKYCANQGLSRTSDMARQLLLYMFHGFFLWTTKNSKKQTVQKVKPFIFFVHKKMVAQRSRFVPKVRVLRNHY